ncbi:DUF1853 family protein [Ketobacter sp.]|uniref:DUF1853 family protein n=1 Tax=Ketobacter sp. TaxID=2083498 RepID=UPI000F2045A4|nr:DUF1853 family protein [Ketobacter sp.]RLT95320.1 MAG: DUF1853 family protein [Ketobacter sp.]
MELQATLQQFQSPHVRDLVWAILSPGLMKTPDHNQHFPDRFYQQAFAGILPHLIELDRHPAPLEAHLEHTTNHRLGPYFERLWLYWLRHNPRYRSLAHNVQIQAEGKTFGEFDLIVLDQQTDEIEHWELAIKFYLGIPPLNNETHWFGPHQKDRLDLKYHHLIEKQLRLSRHSLAKDYCQSRGWNISRSRLLCKGRLFYPSHGEPAHPSNIERHHLRGQWMTEAEFRHQFSRQESVGFHWLNKDEWMVLRSRAPSNLQQILERFNQQRYPHPVQLLVNHWQETPVRLFVVPENWLDRALATLAR